MMMLVFSSLLVLQAEDADVEAQLRAQLAVMATELATNDAATVKAFLQTYMTADDIEDVWRAGAG